MRPAIHAITVDSGQPLDRAVILTGDGNSPAAARRYSVDRDRPVRLQTSGRRRKREGVGGVAGVSIMSGVPWHAAGTAACIRVKSAHCIRLRPTPSPQQPRHRTHSPTHSPQRQGLTVAVCRNSVPSRAPTRPDRTQCAAPGHPSPPAVEAGPGGGMFALILIQRGALRFSQRPHSATGSPTTHNPQG